MRGRFSGLRDVLACINKITINKIAVDNHNSGLCLRTRFWFGAAALWIVVALFQRGRPGEPCALRLLFTARSRGF
jgi:hypothetical protein